MEAPCGEATYAAQGWSHASTGRSVAYGHGQGMWENRETRTSEKRLSAELSSLSIGRRNQLSVGCESTVRHQSSRLSGIIQHRPIAAGLLRIAGRRPFSCRPGGPSATHAVGRMAGRADAWPRPTVPGQTARVGCPSGGSGPSGKAAMAMVVAAAAAAAGTAAAAPTASATARLAPGHMPGPRLSRPPFSEPDGCANGGVAVWRPVGSHPWAVWLRGNQARALGRGSWVINHRSTVVGHRRSSATKPAPPRPTTWPPPPRTAPGRTRHVG